MQSAGDSLDSDWGKVWNKLCVLNTGSMSRMVLLLHQELPELPMLLPWQQQQMLDPDIFREVNAGMTDHQRQQVQHYSSMVQHPQVSMEHVLRQAVAIGSSMTAQ
jgi:hypothetical protein